MFLSTYDRANAQGGRKMAKFENEGWCPNNTVCRNLLGAEDNRLLGLWSIIGPSVVCARADQEQIDVDTEAVNEMFTSDPIAYRLMQSIITYSHKMDKIRIFQSHKDGCNNMQNFRGVLETIQKARNPFLVVENRSRFAVIITGSEDETIVDLYVWDLANCW